MDVLSMCRICFTKNTNMHYIGPNLQKLYEKLTDLPFQTEDNRSLQLCYICYARLRNCYRLQFNCLRSEQLFTQILAKNELKPPLQDTKSLKIVHPILNLSCVPVMVRDDDDEENNEHHYDTTEVKYDVKIKKEIVEDIQDNSTYCTENINYTAPEDIVKIEPDSPANKDNSSEETADNSTSKYIEFNIEEIQIKEENIPTDVEDDGESNFNTHSEEAEDKPIANYIEFDIEESVIKEPNIQTTEIEDAICFQDIKNKQNSSLNHRTSSMDEDVLLKPIKFAFIKPDLDPNNERNEDVNDHIETAKKAYICDLCGKGFANRKLLLRHIYIHRDETPFMCDTCDQCFTVKSALSKHMHTHRFEQNNVSRNAERRKHLQSPTNIAGPSISNTNRVNIYNMTALEKKREYQRMYRENNRERLRQREAERRRRRRLHAEIMKELSTDNTEESQNSYICDLCGKCFTKKRLLLLHIYLHSSETPFQCDTCDQSFRGKNDLNTHICTHRGNTKKQERQRRYRELNREILKQRDAERRKRLQNSTNIIGQLFPSNTNRVKIDKMTALERKREYQRMYRENNRERLKQREAERRRRRRLGAETMKELSNDPNIESAEIIIEPIITINESADS